MVRHACRPAVGRTATWYWISASSRRVTTSRDAMIPVPCTHCRWVGRIVRPGSADGRSHRAGGTAGDRAGALTAQAADAVAQAAVAGVLTPVPGRPSTEARTAACG